MESQIPQGAQELDDVYSNFDHRLERAVVDELEKRSGETFAAHTAYNFCAYIWHKEGKWHEEVWVHGSPRQVVSGEALEDLIRDVNNEYGHD